jgi:hypothetical protein
MAVRFSYSAVAEPDHVFRPGGAEISCKPTASANLTDVHLRVTDAWTPNSSSTSRSR